MKTCCNRILPRKPQKSYGVSNVEVIDPGADALNFVTDFDGVGDGETSNYEQLLAAAYYASVHVNTKIFFPAGTYFVEEYRSIKNDPIDHIYWRNCVGLTLFGEAGTVISMNGDFFRPHDYTTGTAKKSYTSGLCPFWFWYCTDVEVYGMEVTGNVQDTTRLPGVDINNPSVTESTSIMMRFTKCDTVNVHDMFLHHAESDGIHITGDRVNGVWTNSTNFTFTNVNSHHNGRQGMSVTGLSGGVFTNCEYNHTGFTDGTYEHNDPSAGVDVEPGQLHFCRDITFQDCRFEGNYGNHFITSYPATTQNVSLLSCVISTTVETPKLQGITILAKNALIDDCTFLLGTRTMKFTNPPTPGSEVTLRNSTIECSENCINAVSTSDVDMLLMEGNQFNYTEDVLTVHFISLVVKKLSFLNNNIFIPEAAVLSRPTATHCKIEQAIISSGNDFHTENPLVDVDVSYTGTLIVNDL